MQALAAGRPEDFVAAELAARERFAMPPYGRLAAVIVSGKREADVMEAARALANRAPRQQGVAVLGPAPAPLKVLRGLYRYRLLVKAPKSFNIQAYLRRWIAAAPRTSSVRLKVDVDPYSFM